MTSKYNREVLNLFRDKRNVVYLGSVMCSVFKNKAVTPFVNKTIEEFVDTFSQQKELDFMYSENVYTVTGDQLISQLSCLNMEFVAYYREFVEEDLLDNT